MPGRYLRSETATRVAEFIGTRSGRAHLKKHSWKQGMPIVISQPNELLTDAMSLVATHPEPVLVAFLDSRTKSLCFMHVSLPSEDLVVVPCEARDRTTGDFYETAKATFALTFRIHTRQYSAVAHAFNTGDLETMEYDSLQWRKVEERPVNR